MGLQLCRRVGFMSFIFVLIISVMVSRGTADTDTEKDIQECTQQLGGLATCVPYVAGDAKAPTPDCCSGLKQVLQKNLKCLCVIVKDRNDPQLMGLNINATLALGLPSVCHASANISQCPALLHLAPNSTEAQVFYQFAHSSNATSPATSPSSPAASEGNSTSSRPSSDRTSDEAKSDGGCSGKRWLGLDVVVVGVLLWTITSHLFMDVEYF